MKTDETCISNITRRRALIALAMVFLLFQTPAPAQQLVPSEISAVTVFPRGAEVTRSARVELVAGSQQIVLPGLSPQLDVGQLRVSVDRPGVQLGELSLTTVQEEQSSNEKVNELKVELRKILDEKSSIEDGIASAKLQIKLMESVATPAEGSTPGATMDVDNLRKTVVFLGEGSAQAYRAIREYKQQLRELRAREDQLNRALSDAQQSRPYFSQLKVGLNSPDRSEATISITYFFAQAGWDPSYEARLDSDQPTLDLIQKARVYQASNEPWRSVALTLSTSRPDSKLQAPEVGGELLEVRDPVSATAGARPSAALETVQVTAGGQSDRSAVRNLRAPAPPVDMDAGNFATSYKLPGLSTVSNNRTDTSLFELSRFQALPELVTRIVPRQSSSAFLTARFTYTGESRLPSGELRIYVDGRYGGIARIPAMNGNGEIVLPMGVDPSIQMTSTNQGGEKGSKGLLGKRKQETTDFLFSVTNRRASAALIEVLDRIPVAVDRSVKVSVPEAATPPTETDINNLRGTVAWRRTLRPEDSWDISHQYTLSYPADKELVRRVVRN